MSSSVQTKKFQRGRLQVRAVGDRFNIGWVHSYLPATFSPPQYPIDVSGGLTQWGMLGNGPDPTSHYPKGVGDCTFAGRQHYEMAKAACENLPAVTWETADQLVQEYLAYDHDHDIGAVMADVLLAWYQAGKILAFAPVDHTSRSAVDSAMQAFHGCYVGVNLTPDVEQQFQDGQTWALNGTVPNPNDKHCIVKVKASTSSDTWVTWGAEQPSDLDWSNACIEEAWVIISEQDVAATNINIDQLKADITALGGRGGA